MKPARRNPQAIERPPADPTTRVVVISTDDLAAIIEAAVVRALTSHDQAKPPELPEHLTIAEAATTLRCSVQTVRRRIRLRRLVATDPPEGTSSKVLVTRASVLAYLATEARGPERI